MLYPSCLILYLRDVSQLLTAKEVLYLLNLTSWHYLRGKYPQLEEVQEAVDTISEKGYKEYTARIAATTGRGKSWRSNPQSSCRPTPPFSASGLLALQERVSSQSQSLSPSPVTVSGSRPGSPGGIVGADGPSTAHANNKGEKEEQEEEDSGDDGSDFEGEVPRSFLGNLSSSKGHGVAKVVPFSLDFEVNYREMLEAAAAAAAEGRPCGITRAQYLAANPFHRSLLEYDIFKHCLKILRLEKVFTVSGADSRRNEDCPFSCVFEDEDDEDPDNPLLGGGSGVQGGASLISMVSSKSLTSQPSRFTLATSLSFGASTATASSRVDSWLVGQGKNCADVCAFIDADKSRYCHAM